MKPLNFLSGHRETCERRSWRSMMTACSVFLLLAVAGNLAAQTSASSEIKRISDRYALTRARISALLDMRLQPVALPANPPNPFYQAVEETTPAVHEEPAAPDTSNLEDIDVLRKYAATLKVSGVIQLNGVLHLSVNNAPIKAGDVLTVGPKDHPVYLKLVALTPSEFTLGLNDATLNVPLKK
jgi:hypothetical protein